MGKNVAERRNDKLLKKVGTLRQVVNNVPHELILKACAFLEEADRLAQFGDVITPTARHMSPKDTQAVFTALYKCKTAAILAEKAKGV